MPHLVAGKQDGTIWLVSVRGRWMDAEASRLRRMGFYAVSAEEWARNGGTFWPPVPDGLGRLDHLTGIRGRRTVAPDGGTST